MNRAGDPWRRLRDHIQAGIYEIAESAACVEEKSDGEATLQCWFPQVRAIRWKVEKKDLFPVLKSNECADGVLLLCCPDGTWELHLIELKRTVHEVEFSKAKRQMAFALLRVLALCGVLGVEIARLRCYIGFREDKIDLAGTPDLALLKLPIGEPTGETSISDWHRDHIEISGVDGLVPLVKVRLDPATGVGDVSLHPTG